MRFEFSLISSICLVKISKIVPYTLKISHSAMLITNNLYPIFKYVISLNWSFASLVFFIWWYFPSSSITRFKDGTKISHSRWQRFFSTSNGNSLLFKKAITSEFNSLIVELDELEFSLREKKKKKKNHQNWYLLCRNICIKISIST